MRPHGVLHLGRGLDPNLPDALGRRERGARDQRDLRAAISGGGGDRVALLARRPVADEPNRVDGLASAARCDCHADACEVTACRHRLIGRASFWKPGQHLTDGIEDRGRLGEAACPDVPTGETPRLGHHDVHSPAPQHLDVVLHGVVLPHLGVHRWTDDDRCSRGEQRGGEQSVGDAGGVAADDTRRSGRHDHHVGRLAKSGVRDRVVLIEDGRLHSLAGQGIKRRTADEAQRRGGHHRYDVSVGIHHQPAQNHGLVRSDAAADAEHDAAPGERRPGRSRIRGSLGLICRVRHCRERVRLAAESRQGQASTCAGGASPHRQTGVGRASSRGRGRLRASLRRPLQQRALRPPAVPAPRGRIARR